MPTIKKLDLYSYDANPDGSIKISSLMKHFQQIAREDLLQYGISYNMMRDVNQVFVIIKARIEFKRKISIYDELYLKTVPTKIVGITFFRDFFVSDADGNTLAECSTTWVLMNYASRRIMKPKDIVAPVPEFPDEASDIVLTRRFQFEDSPISDNTNVRKIYYSNLDENNHFNNTETAAFALDEVASRLVAGEEIEVFEIHFNHESVLGDELSIKYENYADCCFVCADNINFGENAFECYVGFKS